ncbi:hypothetical protein HMPREF1301_00200 [Propionibacterium sp. KPL2005]|nr:hypothetical protein HMPREF1301_00200 [Propionibacterium sp. KPL2005]ERS26714.1 hypothetical protein HMPREF1297_02304 [Propionibacterium sp. KPL2000]
MVMGRQRLNGPVTQRVAAALEAQRALQGMTYDSLAAKSGLAKGATVYSLKGERGITVDAYVSLCTALDIDPGELLDAAVAATTPDVLTLAAYNPGVPTDRERMEAEWGDEPA